MARLGKDAGIAIGPILFVLAILGILASVFAAGGSGSLGAAGTTDRVEAEIVNQANLIRSKIQECELQYEVNGTNYASAPCAGDPYPCSDQTTGTLASALTCPNDPLDGSNERSLWSGLRPASFPPASRGFNEWYYMNAGASGGRCIWTAPTNGDGSTATVDGLRRATRKFTSQEVSYDSASEGQKFVVFITRPTGTVDAACALP
jgi:type II secretory pathway pseudopilin PulG